MGADEVPLETGGGAQAQTATAGPTTATGTTGWHEVTFEEALQSVGLLEQYLAFKAAHSGE